MDAIFDEHERPSKRGDDEAGPIDCDPCDGVGTLVNAARRIGPSEDGLKVPWVTHGRGTRVFVNSEYGNQLPMWTSRARYFGASSEFGGLRACPIIGLWPSRTDTEWYQRDLSSADAILHWKGRITFRGADAPAPFPSVLPYWGPLPLIYTDYMLDFGSITVTRGPKAGFYKPRRTMRRPELCASS